MIDELIDRFGDPPHAVKGLIDVALLRNTASSLGIYEIKQKGSTLLLYPTQVHMEQVKTLTEALRGKVMLSAGTKPYFSVKMAPDAAPLDALQQVLSLLTTIPASKTNG